MVCRGLGPDELPIICHCSDDGAGGTPPMTWQSANAEPDRPVVRWIVATYRWCRHAEDFASVNVVHEPASRPVCVSISQLGRIMRARTKCA